MRFPVRVPARLAGLAGLTTAIVLGVSATASAQQPSAPPQPRVLIVDNNGGFSPGETGTGMWGYAPAHLAVQQGQTVVFDNPAGNFRPHSVTSISLNGPVAERRLEAGMKFDSSPTRDELLQPGSSFTLDTAMLEPGHYAYYCFIHPWMVGSLTVMPIQ
jgi:plastocyanin